MIGISKDQILNAHFGGTPPQESTGIDLYALLSASPDSPAKDLQLKVHGNNDDAFNTTNLTGLDSIPEQRRPNNTAAAAMRPGTEKDLEADSDTPAPAARRISKAEAAQMKVVRFDSSTIALTSEAFAKEQVQATYVQVSSLAEELVLNGMLGRADFEDNADNSGRTHDSNGGSPSMKLKVFLKPGEKPVILDIYGPCAVKDVIERSLKAASESDIDYELKYTNPAVYDLRILEEDDGTPDEDLPCLDRLKDIRQFGEEAVALCLGDVSDSIAIPTGRTPRKTELVLNERNRSSSQGDKFYVKVFVENESYVIQTKIGIQVKELIPMVAKKKRMADKDNEEDFPESPRHYHFQLKSGEPVEMDSEIGRHRVDELLLIRKLPNIKGHAVQPSFEVFEHQKKGFMEDIAFENKFEGYSEYSVIKTNARGRKQHRVMGIDSDTIFNMKTQGKEGAKSAVARAARPVSSVVSCQPKQSKRLLIIFENDSDNTRELREYDTETTVERDEIVGKINYLMRKQQRQRQSRSSSGGIRGPRSTLSPSHSTASPKNMGRAERSASQIIAPPHN